MLPHSNHPAYRPDIDGLRAIAVLSVLIYHAFPSLVRGGFAGVDVFFVISGYLITTIILKSLENRRFSLADFYARRVLRLFPALLAVLATVLVLAAFVLLPEDYATLGRNTAGGGAFIANLLFASDIGYFMGLAHANPLLHLWSLGIEEQFYLVWPLLLWLAWRLRWNTGVVMGVLIALSFAHAVYMVDTNPSLAFYSPLVRLWELAAGGLLAWLTLYTQGRFQRTLPRLRDAAGFLGLALVLASFWVLYPGAVFPGVGALMPVLGAVLLIAAGPAAHVNRLLLSSRPMVAVGLISYPLYLWHWPLLALLETWGSGWSGSRMAMARACALALSVLLAWATYRYIESPLRRGPGTRRSKVTALALLMVGVVLAGLGARLSKGWPARIPAEVRALVTPTLRDEAWMASLRGGICHNRVYTGAGLGEQEVCLPDEGGPRLLLWGDSHAASLHAGFKALQGELPFSLWQATTDATAPLFADDLRNNMQFTLRRINDIVVDRISQTPPDIVLLHAIWMGYGQQPGELLARIDEAVEKIRAVAPGARVVVLGPVPTWKANLQQNLLNYYWQHGATLPPERMSYGMNKAALEYDAAFRQHFAANGVEYISAVEHLCEAGECLVMTSPTRDGVTYVDEQHLSNAGARYLARQVAGELFGR